MSENTKSHSTTKPSHYVYQVIDSGRDKKFWTKVGAAWPHRDCDGFNLQLASFPLDGRLTLRTVTD